jgi:hypothetical protein
LTDAGAGEVENLGGVAEAYSSTRLGMPCTPLACNAGAALDKRPGRRATQARSLHTATIRTTRLLSLLSEACLGKSTFSSRARTLSKASLNSSRYKFSVCSHLRRGGSAPVWSSLQSSRLASTCATSLDSKGRVLAHAPAV